MVLECSQRMNHLRMFWNWQDLRQGLRLIHYSNGVRDTGWGGGGGNREILYPPESGARRRFSPWPWSRPGPTRPPCTSVPAANPQRGIASCSRHKKGSHRHEADPSSWGHLSPGEKTAHFGDLTRLVWTELHQHEVCVYAAIRKDRWPYCSLQHYLQQPRHGSHLNVRQQMHKWMKMKFIYKQNITQP